MPKIIFTSRYIKNPARQNAGKLVRYMGTREGVEKLPNRIDNSPATKKQKDLIFSLIDAVPEAYGYPEFDDYRKTETKSSSTEFIDAFIERNADRIDGIKKLVSYIGERPGVEKLGRHGLFSQTDDKIDIDAVADEVSNHEGILWTHVVSLRREDAERLGYNNAEAWENLVRRNALQIAEAHKIDVSNLQWYAAFHNTTHHPHIHLMVYSKDVKQGYLTNKGIEDMRGMFGRDIFRNEMYHLFTLETEMRDEVKDEVKERLEDLLSQTQVDGFFSTDMYGLITTLGSQLRNHKGKNIYGYLPKVIKDTVDEIVRELSKDERIAGLYAEWNKINREKLSTYYDKLKPDIPLEENKEFRSIKNAVIKAVVSMTEQMKKNPNIAPPVSSTVAGLIAVLGRLLSSSYQKRREKLETRIDAKLKSKIQEKKAAHGIRTDGTSYEETEDNQGMVL